MIAGEWINENLDKQSDGKIVLFTAPEQPALANRIEGLRKGVLKVAPEAEIIAEQAAITSEAGMNAAEIILQSHPDANVIVCNNDASALGAYEAFVAANKKDICIVGLDATQEALNKIKEGGIMVGTVDIDPKGTGQLAYDTAKKVLAEGDIRDAIEVSLIPVTKKNIDNYFE